MKHNTDNNHLILIINAILLIFFESAIVVGSYMTWALFKKIKNLVIKKKTEFEKKSEFWKKTPWVLKTSEFF